MAEITVLQPKISERLIAQIIKSQRLGDFPRLRSEKSKSNCPSRNVFHVYRIWCCLFQRIDIAVAVYADKKLLLATSHDSDVAKDTGSFVKHQAIGDGAGLFMKI